MEGQNAAAGLRILGDAPSKMLLISGLNGTAAFWRPVQEALADSHTVLAYDQMGCGARPPGTAEISIDTLAEDALDVATQAFGATPMIIVGHSTGGAIAQTVAVRAPHRVRALVLSGAWLRSDTYMQEMFNFRLELLRRAPEMIYPLMELLRKAPSDVQPGDFAPKAIGESDAGNLQARIKALIAFRGDQIAGRIRAPSLVIGADDDRVIPPSLQHELHDAIAGSVLRMMSEGGHFFPATRAAAYCDLIRSWLSGLEDAPDEQRQ